MAQENRVIPDTKSLESSVKILDVYDPKTKILMPMNADELRKSYFHVPEEKGVNIVYEVVYPNDLDLKPAVPPSKIKNRPGRPKKSKVAVPVKSECQAVHEETKVKVVAKTRSGREVKFPKHIQNDFKHIEIDEDPSSANSNMSDIKISDFVCYTDKNPPEQHPLADKVEELVDLDSIKKKRRIAAQYRCPKCQKAYLGRNKILEHLKKNPSHGPMHKSEENHFEVWNYLVSITQKCPSTERGPKFCQELSNLLHNLLLLTNALFKKLGSAANEVKIDKVLGNAIGLTPGTYYFDDNNLYKDVTVLKLMGNTDFLNSIKMKWDDDDLPKLEPKKDCNCGKINTINELMLKSMLISSDPNMTAAKNVTSTDLKAASVGDEKKCISLSDKQPFANPIVGDFEMKCEDEPLKATQTGDAKGQCSQSDKETLVSFPDYHFTCGPQLSLHLDPDDFNSTSYNNNKEDTSDLRTKSAKIKIQSNILIRPPNSKCSTTSDELQIKNNERTDLVDHSALGPSLQDELMLPVSSESNSLLDNSGSSDEVMNVDQFVNERFRKITENLDLSSLDLFQYPHS